MVLGCSDSRLAAEILFDRGLGDLFVVRTAGQVLGPEVLGSLEYGVQVLDCPLIVVLGHEGCGAVAAASSALDGAAFPTGYVGDVVEHSIASVLASRAAGRTRAEQVLADHVSRTLGLLLDRSQLIRDRVDAGQLGAVGRCYSLADGSVNPVAVRGLPGESNNL